MKEIKCPNCQTVFKIDDDSYYEILKQIKDEELEKERTVLEQ
ncbi:MJ0042-type zinc finger domain-containing protein, partial [Faecalicoccus pleomorphus]